MSLKCLLEKLTSDHEGPPGRGVARRTDAQELNSINGACGGRRELIRTGRLF